MSFARVPLVAIATLLPAFVAAGCSDDLNETPGQRSERLTADESCDLSRTLQRAALGRDSAEDDPIVEEDDTGSFARGKHEFSRRKFVNLVGNGRACADCHDASDNFQLSPAKVKARFDAFQACKAAQPNFDDPLFRAVDADDFVTAGNDANSFTNLVENGLIRIRFDLPPNVKLVDPASCKAADGTTPAPCQTAAFYSVSSETFTDVWRSVPSINGVGMTGPDGQLPEWPRGVNRRGGYQLDARVDTLQNQALGAFHAHAQFVNEPRQKTLDAIAVFEQSLPLPAGAAITPGSLEEQGQAVFNRACATCHGGPAGNLTGVGMPVGVGTPHNRFHDVSTICPRPVDAANPPRWNFAAAFAGANRPDPCATVGRTARTYEVTFADGFKFRRTTTDPGRFLKTGFIFSAGPPAPGGVCAHPPCGPGPGDDFQKMDVPTLFGVSKTAPYFSNNSGLTLEDVVINYEEVFKRASALNPTGGPLTPDVLTTGTITCGDPRCANPTPCSADNWCRDRPNVPSERAALVAFMQTL